MHPRQIVSTATPQAVFTEGKVDGVAASILVDTGSAVTIVHRRLWERGQGDVRKLQQVSGGPVVVANGEPLHILGQTQSKIHLAGIEFAHNVLITGDVSQDCLLGADFLTSHGFVIDLQSQVLRQGQLSTPLLLQRGQCTSALSVCKVSVGNTVILRAGEEKLLFVNIDNSSYPTGTAGVLEPKEGFEDRHQLLVARVVATPDDGVVPLRVANLTTSAITLYRGTNIAKFCPLVEPDSSEAETAEYCEIPLSLNTDQVCQVGVQQTAASLLEIDTSAMDQNQKMELEELVQDFADVFSTGKQDLGRTDLVYHSIPTGDAAPIKQASRRLPVHYQPEVSKLLDEMQQQGIIEPSCSPWASPIVLVRKKDGSLRFCVDYRKLNKVTKKDSYPLPRVDDLLDSLADAQWFSTLDLRSGYWQVEVNPADREKTAFSTPHGLFQFRVMPFGLCNAPSTFQRLMGLVMAGFRWEICLAYLDDVVVFGRTWKEHLERLRLVLTRLQEAHLKLHPRKCQFFKQSVYFLGHVISNNGVSTDPAKISIVSNWPTPTNVTELRSFLGLASYYRRFIRHFAEVAAPLYCLQEKGSTFRWTANCRDAFEILKKKLTSAPILAFPKPSDTFILDTDASECGIGAVLSQRQEGIERVIAYGSRTLTKSERNYSTTHKELLALVYFVQHFRCYLLGHPFIVRTDHAALTWLQQFKHPEGQLARWLEQLQEFEFQTEHRPGKQHCNADALSRLHQPQTSVVYYPGVQTVEHTWALSWSPEELKQAQSTDPTLGVILAWMKQEKQRPSRTMVAGKSSAVHSLWAQWSRLEVINGLLYRWWEEVSTGVQSQQLIVPQSLRSQVLKALHDAAGGGHLGVHKTLVKARERFYWPGLRKDVEDWCQKCRDCAESKSPSTCARGPLSPSVVGYPMERIALDVFGPLPVTQHGNKYILVVSDYFTRWVEAYPLPNQEASTVAKVLVNEWVCRFGAPDVIHSDQGKNFESHLFAEVCHLLGMEKTRTTPYHPQSDGLVERFNRTLRMLLTIRMNQVPEDTWDEELPMLMLAYRSSVQESTRFTPYRLMFGREVQLPVDIMFGGGPTPGKTHSEYVTQLDKRLEQAYEVVREHLKTTQKYQKQCYDRKATGGRYQPGDLVWLYSPAVPKRRCPKFHRPWKGPYQVRKVLSDVTYRIQLVKSPKNSGDRRCKRRVVVHFNRLKPCSITQRQETETPQSSTDTPQSSTDTQLADEAPPVEDVWTPLLEQAGGPDHQPSVEEPEQLRGGAVWGGRLRRNVWAPDCFRPGTVATQQRGE